MHSSGTSETICVMIKAIGNIGKAAMLRDPRESHPACSVPGRIYGRFFCTRLKAAFACKMTVKGERWREFRMKDGHQNIR